METEKNPPKSTSKEINFQIAIEFVLKYEGGYVNHPNDEVTNWGVTKDTWENWVGHPVSIQDMKNLPKSAVYPLYEERYWKAAGCHLLPSPINLCIFDFAVNSGVSRAVSFLQKCSGSGNDGIVGPKTINAAKKIDPKQLLLCICTKRLEFLRSLKKHKIFGRGWERRIQALKEKCLQFVKKV